jgi:hypothetical protein
MGVTIEDTGLMDKIDAGMKDLRNKSVLVGWFENAVYPNGEQVAYVAAIQEFGAPEQNIPARPFLIPTFNENKDEWTEILKEGVTTVLSGKLEARGVLAQLGKLASDQVAEKIQSITDPPLAESTIQARLDKKANNQIVADNTTRHEDVNGDSFYVTGEADTDIGMLGKPLIDTGLMFQSVSWTVKVGNR